MLRLRLYIGMLPVAGLLIAICLYSVYNYKKLNDRLEALQTVHYTTVSEIERLLSSTAQIGRAIRLNQFDKNESAQEIYQENRSVLSEWKPSPDSSNPREFDLAELVAQLEALAIDQFADEVDLQEVDQLIPLLAAIEDNGRAAIADRNATILAINQSFQEQARTHYYVVLGGILLGIGLMAWAAYSLSQRILTPIDSLAQFASRLADDDWETDFKPSSKDEISGLEEAFLEMAQRIRLYKRETDKKILRTRRRMEECFSNLPYPVFFINSKRDIVYRNPSAKELIDELDWQSSFPPSINARIERVFGTGEEMVTTEFDETITFKVDNHPQHYLPTVLRIDSEDTEEIECALILQDITQLRLSDELKSDMVATISHEIKTPVTGANMALHLLLEQGIGSLNEDQREMLETATEDLRRLQRLLEHLLQIARLERKSPSLNTTPVRPARIVQTAIEAHAHHAASQSITLRAQVEANLPQVLADPNMIDVALSNFISNAIKYGGANSRIDIYARLGRDDQVQIGVLDEGPGIPDEDVDKVFEKFYRSSKHDSVKGIGLGLSICKDIVAAHGGSVGCRNRPSKGAEMFFSLPKHESDASRPSS
ncbi:ATP-binding protein [Pelagicoccus sp. SDUM812003]|uniref:sensor histidine kinase n=1 Tax=Pelagicoccus sp. SDUM812003 TaxID=3041267 RepID=UPI0028106695|nr:ATP-binding protein [Pelagicoccus sp. SDUM812003]MDQ8204649.1 ATP-binding protein [Pelagicoccus sp. SDUM812003]